MAIWLLCTHSCGPHAGGGGAGHAGGGGADHAGGGGGGSARGTTSYCTRVGFVQGVVIGRRKCH